MNRSTSRLLVPTFLAVAAFGCSNHRVSPWGRFDTPPLGLYAESPNLPRWLAEAEREERAAGLSVVEEGRAKVSDEWVTIRSLSGRDAMGREAFASRAISPFGIVLAIGPLPFTGRNLTVATELVIHAIPHEIAFGMPNADDAGMFDDLPPPAQLWPPRDLDKDGRVDIALRSNAGTLELWSISVRGSAAATVTLEAPLRQLADLDGDGLPELLGSVKRAPGIGPFYVDAAFLTEGRWSNTDPRALAFHRSRADLGEANSEDGARRVRRALERAWHRLLAGDDPTSVRADLDKTDVPQALATEFDALKTRLDKIAPRTSGPRESPSEAPR